MNFLPRAGMICAVFVLAACGDGSTSPTPGETPTATPTPSNADPGRPPVAEARTVTFYGGSAGDSVGAIAAGDFNGNGVLDVVITSAQADGTTGEAAGTAYVFLGPFEPGQEFDIAAQDYDVVVTGPSAGAQLGRSMAIGDFNGDGIDDIAIGAPFAEHPGIEGQRAGAVYVLSGNPDLGGTPDVIDLATDRLTLTIYGASTGDLVGFSLAAGDLTGDGIDDLVLGAFGAGGAAGDRPDSGEAYVIFGGADLPETIDLSAGDTPDTAVYGARSGDKLGEGVGTADVTGDGTANLILAAPFAAGAPVEIEAAGRVYIFHSLPPAVTDLATYQPTTTIVGIDPGDQVGHSMAFGDVTSDGASDLLLGAVSADGPENELDLAGEVYLLPGQRLAGEIRLARDGSATVIYGSFESDRFGRNVAIGDISGDGRSDLIVAASDAAGAGGTLRRSGAIYLFHSRIDGRYPSSSAGADLALEGDNENVALGQRVFGTPSLSTRDMNGDGREEILTVAPSHSGRQGEENAGRAYIVYLSR